jgi:hypothetical protein
VTESLPAAWSGLHQDLERLPQKLQLLLIGLYEAAERVAQQYPVRPSEQLCFCPVSALAHSLGVRHNTISTWFRRYRSVLRRVVHYSACTSPIYDARTDTTTRWHAGALWLIRLSPPRGELRMRDEFFEHDWRDLAQDIRDGTTLRQSGQAPQKTVLETVIAWHPAKPVVLPPSELDRRNPEWQVLDAHDGPSIDRAARAIASELQDRSVGLWRKLVWHAHRTDSLRHLANMFGRVLIDRQEWPGLRSPAALLVKRCQKAGLLG